MKPKLRKGPDKVITLYAYLVSCQPILSFSILIMNKPSSPREFLTISTSSNTNKIIPVCFEEDWNVGIGGGLWSTGLALAYYFIDHRLDFARQLSNIVRRRKASSMKMIELGSGNGFLSIVLSACLLACRYECLIDFHTDLVATDLEDHLNMIRRTMQSNDHIVELDTEKEAEKYDQQTYSEKIKISVKEHAWGVFSNCEAMIASDEKFDFIFGRQVCDFFDTLSYILLYLFINNFYSDLAYRDYLHSPLVRVR